MASFQREILTPTLWDELYPLFELHYKEIAHHKDIPLSPEKDLYFRAEEAGMLRVYTARDNGEAIGYAWFFVKTNPHYSTSLQAQQDIIFIHPERRGFGAKFIAWCDEQLAAEKVQAVYHHVKQAHNFGPLLERMGYKLVDLIYTRRLD
jgi:GNAT superfamily N-acetyltransferase